MHKLLANNNELATKRGARKLAYRNKILRSAEEIFLEKGFRLTSTDEIASRAGVTKRTLYKYFPSKLALYVGMYDDYLCALHREISKISKLTLPSDQLLFRYFDVFFKFTKKNERFMRLFYWVSDAHEFDGNIPDELKNKINEHTRETEKIVEDHLKRVFKDGKVINIQPRLLINVIEAINKGIFIHANKEQRFRAIVDISPETLFDLFKIILKGGVIRSSPNLSKDEKYNTNNPKKVPDIVSGG
jgi:AcrR family transcriptional regulator